MGAGIATGWKARVLFPTEARNFSLHGSDQSGSGADSASYQMGAGEFFARCKVAGQNAGPPVQEARALTTWSWFSGLQSQRNGFQACWRSEPLSKVETSDARCDNSLCLRLFDSSVGC
jgi:hypothetical protein